MQDRLHVFGNIAKKVIDSGEMNIKILGDKGRANTFPGCQTLNSDFRIIEVNKEDYEICYIIDPSLVFNHDDLSQNKYYLLVSTNKDERIEPGIHTFFYYTYGIRNKPTLKWKSFPNMVHPLLYVLGKRKISNLERQEKEVQTKEIPRDLEEEIHRLKEKCKLMKDSHSKLEEVNLNLKRNLDLLNNDFVTLKNEMYMIKRKLELTDNKIHKRDEHTYKELNLTQSKVSKLEEKVAKLEKQIPKEEGEITSQ